MELLQSSWPEIECYLERSNGIFIPIGSTEQHGPTGLIGTDIICPEVIARRASDLSDSPILIGPSINVGVAQHHLGFPGSMTLRPSTLIALIGDHVQSLMVHGFRRFVFVNGHGGNIATIQAAFSEIYARFSLEASAFPDVRCKLINWFMLPDVQALARELYGDKEGSHATPSEVAVTQFAYPDSIKVAELAPLPTDGTWRPFTHSKDYRSQYPDGRMRSDPSLATIEHGRQFVELAAANLLDQYQAFNGS